MVTFLLTAKPDAEVSFYREAPGFACLRDDGFALVFGMNGIMPRVGKVARFAPAQIQRRFG